MILLIKLIVLFLQCHSQSGQIFWYRGSSAPNTWGIFAGCQGKEQSPIDFKTATDDENLSAITFEGYDTTPTAMSINNFYNGVFCRVQGVIPSISIDSTSNRYNFLELEFHWGSVNGQGSEHTINGKQYDAEIQFRHANDNYSTYGDAQLFDDGVVFLAVVVEVGDANSNIDELIKTLPDIIAPDETKSVTTPFPIKNFLPDNTAYYRYKGSETRPDCDQKVVWIVFTNPITMSQAQIDQFKLLNTTDNADGAVPLVDNFRPVQPLNGREVKRFVKNGNGNGCSRLYATRIIFTLSLVVPVWLHLQN